MKFKIFLLQHLIKMNLARQVICAFVNLRHLCYHHQPIAVHYWTE